MSGIALHTTVAFDRIDPVAARRTIRAHGYTGYTAGIAPGRVQANVCILPRAFAEDFLLDLPAQSEAVPVDRPFGSGRPACFLRSPTISISAPIFRAITSSRDGVLAEEHRHRFPIGATIS